MTDERADRDGPSAPGRRCPICGKPTEQRYRPFCSRRCADIDLQRWLTGAYAIPVVEEDASVDPSADEEGR